MLSLSGTTCFPSRHLPDSQTKVWRICIPGTQGCFVLWLTVHVFSQATFIMHRIHSLTAKKYM